MRSNPQHQVSFLGRRRKKVFSLYECNFLFLLLLLLLLLLSYNSTYVYKTALLLQVKWRYGDPTLSVFGVDQLKIRLPRAVVLGRFVGGGRGRRLRLLLRRRSRKSYTPAGRIRPNFSHLQVYGLRPQKNQEASFSFSPEITSYVGRGERGGPTDRKERGGEREEGGGIAAAAVRLWRSISFSFWCSDWGWQWYSQMKKRREDSRNKGRKED